MPEKRPKANDEFPEAIQGMLTTAFVSLSLFFVANLSKVSSDGLDFLSEDKCSIGIICIKFNFSSVVKLLNFFEKPCIWLLNKIVYWRLTCGFLSQSLKKCLFWEWFHDHVYKETKENPVKFLDDSYCFENLQRLCCLQDVFIILYWNLVEKESCLAKPFSYFKWFCQHYILQGHAFECLNGAREIIPNNTKSALEEMLEKKISCNGSTAATTLINLNSNINKSNCNESTSSSNNSATVSNSNTKSTCSSNNSENVLASSGVSKPFDGMAIKTEDNAIKNICKTEIESEKVDPLSVTSSNVPAVTPVCDSKPTVTTSSPLQQSSASTTPVSAANVNGAGIEKPNLSTSPGNTLSVREPKNEKCVPQPAIPFTENQSEIIGGNKDNHPANNGNGTPITCPGAIKSEGIPCGGVNLGPQCGGGSVLHGSSGIGGPQVTVPTCISIQPLPSNMLNKSSSSIESQYMQQQSQIFVFSTGLANQAAEAVLSEHYPSIIAFHCAQPGTVRFLEKHPLKVQQFHRHSSAMWLNNLAQMKQGNRQMKMGSMNSMQSGPFMNHQFPGGSCGQCHSPCNHLGNHPSHMSAVGPRGPMNPGNCGGNQEFAFGPRNSWPHGMNGANVNCGPRFPGPQGNRPMFSHGMGSHCPDNIRPCGDYLGADNLGACSMMDSNKLNSVKVPDENLTPEQRQHRKEQLVILRNLGQLLLPDLHSPNVNDPNNMNQVTANQQMHVGHCQGDMCNHGGIIHPHSNDMDGGRHPQTMGMNQFLPHKDPVGNANDQVDWQRMNQFYDDRIKGNMPQSPHPQIQSHQAQLTHLPITPQSGVKQQPSLSSPSPTVGASPNATIRVQGPPPPYHQGSRCPVPSPHPASPSTISLSSPHVTSGLASPADPSRSFPHPPSSNRLSHPSPGGGGSLHSTPLNSPKPVNSSNCGSSGSLHMPKTSTTPIPISTPTSVQPSLPSSPGAAVSSAAGGSRKAPLTPGSASQSGDLEFGTLSQPLTPSSDPAMFGSNRSLHLCGQSPRATPKPVDVLSGAVGQNCPGKEPSLMPVPSPQQIQYLNAFEGQELTIQKQPNTSLRETDLISQNVPSGEETMNRSCPPFVASENPRNAFTNVTGSCNTNLCSCGDVSNPRFSHMNNDMTGRMYPVHQHPNIPGADGMHRFRGNTPSNLQHQVPGNMLRCGMLGPNVDGTHRYRGPINNMQNEMVNPRFPSSMNISMRPEGMMYRPPLLQGNPNNEHMAQRQYSSPVPSMYDPNLPGSHHVLSHNLHPNIPNLQKSNMPFDHSPSKTSSPLNPHMTGDDSSSSMSMPCGSQRLSHFDPIASMTAMSDSTIGSPGINNRNQNPGASNLQMGNNLAGCHPGIPVNFNSNMQTMQGVNQPNGNPNMMHGSPFVPGPNGQTISLTPQTVNSAGTFVNATMSIQQQLNIQNVTTSNYNNVPSASPTPSMMQMQQQLAGPNPSLTGIAGGNTVSSSASTNQPIMHSGIAPKSICGPRSNSAGLPQQFPGSPLNAPPKRGSSPLPQNNVGMMPRNPGAVGSPGYMSPNVHVKASAPNTIQYLPARPQNCTSISNRPPSLDFLQRYASPLTNLDSKVPTHNLQYFPNANVNNGAGSMHLPPVGDNGLVTGSHDLENQGRSMGQLNRCNIPPFVSGPHNANMTGQHLLPNSQMVNDNGEFRTTGGGPLMNAGPAINVGSMGSPLGMFHGNKHMPLSPSGMAPDTTQPLPSSMGQSLNYKQSPFYGPTTADPNYAVQFHNFQQQLYATNTRGNQGNSQNVTSSPSFFNIK